MKIKGHGRFLFLLIQPLWTSARDLLPIIAVIGFFQLVVFRQALPNLGSILVGLACVVLGLSLFLIGLEKGLFPIGKTMAADFAQKGNVFWLVAFAFALGVGTTFAEPALIAIADRAEELHAMRYPSELVSDPESTNANSSKLGFSLVLRTTVAISVGVALILGVVRILKGWPIQYVIIAGYFLVILLTPFVPKEFVAIAYDSGGVTTSTITVPLTTALGVGLASSIRGRNPLLDGFGLIAFASLTPILFVLILGIFYR